MDDLLISLDDGYDGEIDFVLFDRGRGVKMGMDEEGRVVCFTFSHRKNWSRKQATNYLRKRNLNNLLLRKDQDGSLTTNSINLTATIGHIYNSGHDLETAEKILGPTKFKALSEIEQKHGGDIPFLFDIVAMNFAGKDKAVFNRFEFDRKGTTDMIKEFNGLPMHLGHLNFSDFIDPIGNSVASMVDPNGNPVILSYIFPHGKAGEFRESLLIAQAQGLLGKKDQPFGRVSVAGDPVEFTEVQSDDKDFGKIFVRLQKWTPTAVDFVTREASKGSKVRSIKNRERGNRISGGKKLETLSDVLEFLKTHGAIALSDFMQIPAFKSAVDSHTKLTVDAALEKQKIELSSNKEFAVGAIEKLDSEEIAGVAIVNSVVNERVEARKRSIDSTVDKLHTLASNAKVELTDEQALLVKSNLTGEEEEPAIIELIKSVSKFSHGLTGVIGSVGLGKEADRTPKIALSGNGASVEEVSPEKLSEALMD